MDSERGDRKPASGGCMKHGAGTANRGVRIDRKGIARSTPDRPPGGLQLRGMSCAATLRLCVPGTRPFRPRNRTSRSSEQIRKSISHDAPVCAPGSDRPPLASAPNGLEQGRSEKNAISVFGPRNQAVLALRASELRIWCLSINRYRVMRETASCLAAREILLSVARNVSLMISFSASALASSRVIA